MRCPKCRSETLRLYEGVGRMNVFDFVDGKVVSAFSDSDELTGKYQAVCECGHNWKPRFRTGFDAVDTARDVLVDM